jgi:hypothetical protein
VEFSAAVAITGIRYIISHILYKDQVRNIPSQGIIKTIQSLGSRDGRSMKEMPPIMLLEDGIVYDTGMQEDDYLMVNNNRTGPAPVPDLSDSEDDAQPVKNILPPFIPWCWALQQSNTIVFYSGGYITVPMGFERLYLPSLQVRPSRWFLLMSFVRTIQAIPFLLLRHSPKSTALSSLLNRNLVIYKSRIYPMICGI